MKEFVKLRPCESCIRSKKKFANKKMLKRLKQYRLLIRDTPVNEIISKAL